MRRNGLQCTERGIFYAGAHVMQRALSACLVHQALHQTCIQFQPLLFNNIFMKPVAPGTVIFHRYRGYGVITSVNLLTGWISARFGSEVRTLDLNLSSDEVQHADGEPILFRRAPPDRMPHARLMALVRELHRAGYQRLYLYSWPKPSGLHWRWHLFTGQRNWMERPWREGWYGSGADYNFNPVLGWSDAPGESAAQLASTLARFDPHGLAQALGRDEDHTAWFDAVCALWDDAALYHAVASRAHAIAQERYSEAVSRRKHLDYFTSLTPRSDPIARSISHS